MFMFCLENGKFELQELNNYSKPWAILGFLSPFELMRWYHYQILLLAMCHICNFWPLAFVFVATTQHYTVVVVVVIVVDVVAVVIWGLIDTRKQQSRQQTYNCNQQLTIVFSSVVSFLCSLFHMSACLTVCLSACLLHSHTHAHTLVFNLFQMSHTVWCSSSIELPLQQLGRMLRMGNVISHTHSMCASVCVCVVECIA